jgi:hypothetical protein
MTSNSKEELRAEPAKDPRNEIQNLSQLSNLLYHRNKNQHRRSHWWRHFNVFRRQLRSISTELGKQTPSARGGNTIQDSELSERLQQRLRTWTEVYVVKWYGAFSQVLAEKRFVPLGLVLLAILGKACALLGVLEDLVSDGDDGVGRSLEAHADSNLNYPNASEILATSNEDMFGDLGVVVARDDAYLETVQQPRAEDGFRPKSKPKSSPMTKEMEVKSPHAGDSESTLLVKRKKTKRKGNAIDDLFDSLD